jgi:hypothetical protein
MSGALTGQTEQVFGLTASMMTAADRTPAEEALAALHGAIDALAAVELSGLADDDLHALVIAVQRERARLGVVAASLLDRWDTRRIWASDGSRNAAGRLSRETACSAASAGVEMRRARHQRTLPATTAAIARGELSLDHLDLMGRANQAHRGAHFARDEAFLVEQCTRLRFAPAVRMVGYWCRRVDADVELPEDYGRPEDGVQLHAAVTIGGTVVVNGVLDPVGGSIVMNELDRLEHELYLVDQHDGTIRTASARRAPALVVMAQRSATPARGRAPRPLFSVLLGDTAFTELCELANGTVVTPRQLAPWLDTADLETILFDGPSTVVSVSQRRTFTGAVRRAIEVRDRHCQHPAGCDVPADRCDVDHIVPHCRGGPTSQFNGRLECATHNRHTDKHDHDAVALPARPITALDVLRARIRWRTIHDHPEDYEPLGPSP